MTAETTPDKDAAYDEVWINPFVAIAHRLIETPEPFMLTGIVENDAGTAVSCHCYYHTVVFDERQARVFTNEAGGMCPTDDEHLVGVYELPEDYRGKFHDFLAGLKEQVKGTPVRWTDGAEGVDLTRLASLEPADEGRIRALMPEGVTKTKLIELEDGQWGAILVHPGRGFGVSLASGSSRERALALAANAYAMGQDTIHGKAIVERTYEEALVARAADVETIRDRKALALPVSRFAVHGAIDRALAELGSAERAELYDKTTQMSRYGSLLNGDQAILEKADGFELGRRALAQVMARLGERPSEDLSKDRRPLRSEAASSLEAIAQRELVASLGGKVEQTTRTPTSRSGISPER